MVCLNRFIRMQMRAGKVETGDTLVPTVTPHLIERGQRNEGGPEPFQGKISKVLVMLRSGGNYVNYVLCVCVCTHLISLTHSFF